MGALDDAIREHLELKRRHGASDEEIRQAEAEALGPARRTPGSGLSAVPGETALDEAGMPAPIEAFEPPPDPGSAVHDAPPPPAPDEGFADEGFADEGPPVHDAAAEPVAPVEPEPIEPIAPESPPPEPPPPDDPERARTAILDDPLRDPPPVHHEPGPDEPPAPARPPEAAAPPAPDPDLAEEDVLEETPDFLQETPEHDRLWFEQKPPRDFDFD